MATQLNFPGLGVVSFDVVPTPDNCGMATLRYLVFRPLVNVPVEHMYKEFYSFIIAGTITEEGKKLGYKLPKWDSANMAPFWMNTFLNPKNIQNTRALFLLSGPLDTDKDVAYPKPYQTVQFCLYNKLPILASAPNAAHQGDRRTALFAIEVPYTANLQADWSK